MIYITGDTHGYIERFFDGSFAEESTLSEGDYLIVCGDFGFVFQPYGGDGFMSEWQDLKYLSQKPYTILFVDGNHENFDRLNGYDVELWHGGKIHKIAPNIFHLMRGQVYDICGYSVFTMGGAYSVDRHLRTEGYTWWPEELPTSSEYNEAVSNLDRVGRKVDLILSHTAPREIIKRMGFEPERTPDVELTGFLEWVMYEVEFKRLFFGHWHLDQDVTEKIRAIYSDVEKFCN